MRATALVVPDDDFLAGTQVYRVMSAPRPPEDPNLPDPVPAQLFAAVTSMHATLGPAVGPGEPLTRPLFLSAWIRRPTETTASGEDPERFVFLLGGRPGFPPVAPGRARPDGTRGLLFPPGATGVQLADGEASRLLEEFPVWLSCHGAPDALWSTPNEEAWQTRRGSFDEYAAHLAYPFAWLVLAEPRPADLTDAERARLENAIPELREAADTDRWVELERAESRHRELARYGGAGMWDVRVLVGSRTPAGARAAAALLCGAAELGGLPYTLAPSGPPGPLREVAARASARPRRSGAADVSGLFAPGAPFTASGELLAALARPPSRELPGIRLLAPHRFDVTRDRADADGFRIGTVLDSAYAEAGALVVSRPTLNRHAFVCGATGSGKSQTTRTLLAELSAAGVPWLVIEPAKSEYARMAGRLRPGDTVTVLRPGEPGDPPACVNPLEPEPGYPLQSHADLVRELFLAAFDADNPVPQILSIALAEVYEKAGWDMVTGRPRPAERPRLLVDEETVAVRARYPTLGELRAVAARVVDDVGYGREVRDNVRGLVDVRIRGLREGTPGRFFEGGHPIALGSLLRTNTVLELDRVTSDQDKAFVTGIMLIRIVEFLRTHPPEPGAGLRHVLVLEEAHRLLRRDADGPAGNAVELFAGLLAEIRAYGEGVVVVEQIPAKIIPDVLKNTALKVMHRLPAADDRESVGATMNLRDEQSEQVVALPPGQAAVALDGMDRPVLVQIDHGEDAESDTRAVHAPPLRDGETRSHLCPAECTTAPCSLGAMNDARHAARSALLVLWVEAVTAAHISGRRPPEPSAAVVTALTGLPARLRACTLAHAVERAVEARRPLLRPWLDPADLADYTLAVLTARLGLGPEPTDDYRRYQAGLYRWIDVRAELQVAAERPGSAGGPHPLTAQWARRGLDLEGADIAAQWRSFREHPAHAEGSHRVAIGAEEISGLAAAVTEVAGASGSAFLRRALRRACAGDVEGIAAVLTGPGTGDDPALGGRP